MFTRLRFLKQTLNLKAIVVLQGNNNPLLMNSFVLNVLFSFFFFIAISSASELSQKFSLLLKVIIRTEAGTNKPHTAICFEM